MVCVNDVCDMTHFICVTWPIHMWNMTLSHVRHDAFIHAAWLNEECDMTQWCVWHDSMLWVIWLNDVCGWCVEMTERCVCMMKWCVWIMTVCVNDDIVCEIYMQRDSMMCVTWLNDVHDMTQRCVWHDSRMCVKWLSHTTWSAIHTYDVTYSRVWYDSFILNSHDSMRQNTFLQECVCACVCI